MLKEERWLNHNVGMFCGIGYAQKYHSVQNSVQYIKSNVMSNVYKFTYGKSSSIHPKKSRQPKKSFASAHLAKKSWDAAGCRSAVSRLAIEIEVREEELSFWRTDG